MTPKPTVVDDGPHLDDSGPGDPGTSERPSERPSTWASDIAFGSESSASAAEANNDNGSLPLLIAFIGAIVAIGFLRSWWFPGIVAGLLFMLFMHELGHYLTARASGMKVTEFFLGFGPKIWSFNRGETEYGVKGIPAGAYVRIIGMTNLDEIDPAEEHRTYRAQPYWQRMMVICAGSAMHFLMAGLALVVLFAAYSYPGFNGPPWQVGQVVEASTASQLGIQAGDELVSINGQTFDNWDEFGDVVGALEQGPVEIDIRRDGVAQTLNGELGLRAEDVMLDGFGLSLPIEIPGLGSQATIVWPQDPASIFGIEPGDLVTSAGGVDAPTESTMAAMLQARVGDTIEIDVLRDFDTPTLRGSVPSGATVDEILAALGAEPGDRLLSVGDVSGVSPEALDEALEALAGQQAEIGVLRGGQPLTLSGTVELRTSVPFRGFFGVGPTFAEPADRGLIESVGKAVDDFGTIATVNTVGIIELANPLNWGGDDDAAQRRAEERRQRQIQQTAPVPTSDDCDGPDTNRPLSMVGIGRLISCSESADQVFFLFAVVNIFIGIFNLVPLLPLDGGHAAIATYERARGLVTGTPHRVDAAKLIPVTWLVILALAALGLWTTTLDIFSW